MVTQFFSLGDITGDACCWIYESSKIFVYLENRGQKSGVREEDFHSFLGSLPRMVFSLKIEIASVPIYRCLDKSHKG